MLLSPVLASVGPAAHGQPSAFHPDGGAPDWERPAEPGTEPEASLPTRFLESQSLKARIGQLMLVTLEGATKPSPNDLAFLREVVPGGVGLAQSSSADSAAAYVNMLRAVEAGSGTPLLIGTDLYQFTSATRTGPASFVQLPSLLSITAAGNSDIVKSLGRLMAQHALHMGFNFHIGPTLELAPTLPGASSAIQTFGSDPRFAAEAGGIFNESFLESGLIFMPVGFPGGGANKVGRGASVLTTPRPLLAETDGMPYQALIRQGVKMLHVGNVLSPTIDMENRPASMSAAVISEILRGEMGYSGVVVAGPMDEEVLRARYDSGEAAVQSLLAGADMLFWSGGLSLAARAVAHIEAAVHAGILSETRINESLARILELKQSLPRPDKPLKEHQAGKQTRHKEIFETSVRIERHAITLLKNDNNVLPLVKKVSPPVGITGTTGVEELHELLQKQLKPVVQQRITTARHIGEIQRFEIERLTRHMTGLRTIICILTDDVRPETQAELVRALKANAPHVIVLYLGHPQNATHITMADAVLLAYCESITVGQTIQAMSEILMGVAPISILPVDNVIRLKVGETRSFNAYEIIRAPSGRLPIQLGDRFPAGASARYNPAESVKRVEWEIAGRRTRKESVAHTFDKAGEIPVRLTVTDAQNDVHTRQFTIIATE